MSKLSDEAAAFIKTMKKEGVKPNLQREIEAELGRPLEDFEAIFFVKGSLEVGLRPGVPYIYLQCGVCKNRLFTVVETTCLQDPETSADGGY
jgi:hypothetical protein